MAEFDLLTAIKMENEEGVHFVDGLDNFPAYGVTKSAQIKSPFRFVLPPKLNEFAIMATVLPETRSGGYLFSIVNPYDTLVQLGIQLTPVVNEKYNISVIYTDFNKHVESQIIASFELNYSKKWKSYAFEVQSDSITFYYNCVQKEKVTIKRDPTELVFDSASILYIAQAGPILRGNFEVSYIFFFFLTDIKTNFSHEHVE